MDKAKGRTKEAAGSLAGNEDRKAEGRRPGQGHPQKEEGRREGPLELIASRQTRTVGRSVAASAFLLPLFTGVRGRVVLRTSRRGGSTKFA